MKRYYKLLGFVIFGIVLMQIDFQKMLANFSQINVIFFILINLLILPALFLKAYRWRYLLQLQGIDYSIRNSFISYLGGIYAGIITPGRIGEAIKAFYLKQDKDIPIAEGLAGIFIDRLFDLYVLVFLGLGGVLNFINMKIINYNIWIYSLILVLLAIPLLILNKPLLEKISHIFYKLMILRLDKNLMDGQFKVFFGAVKKIVRKRIYFPFILTILAYLVYFLECYLLTCLASIDISYLNVIFFISISSLVSIVPITILGIGTRELSLVYFFSLIGLCPESALTYSFLLFFSSYVISGFIGFIGWHIKGNAKVFIN